MNDFMVPVLIVTGIGILAGVILSAAAKFMAVKVDERFEKIRAELPGANCGACGYAGCDQYAQALVENPDLATNLCVPGGAGAASFERDHGRALLRRLCRLCGGPLQRHLQQYPVCGGL